MSAQNRVELAEVPGKRTLRSERSFLGAGQ